MKKTLPFLLFLAITVSCSPITVQDNNVATYPVSTNTIAVTSSPIPTPAKTSTPQSSHFVQVKYPNHEFCTVQVNTQKWMISEEASQYITSASTIKLASHAQGYGSSPFVDHKTYEACFLRWVTNEKNADGFEKTSETISNTTWDVWYFEPGSTKVYFWPKMNQIQFVQYWPLRTSASDKELCQTDIYEILASFECQ